MYYRSHPVCNLGSVVNGVTVITGSIEVSKIEYCIRLDVWISRSTLTCFHLPWLLHVFIIKSVHTQHACPSKDSYLHQEDTVHCNKQYCYISSVLYQTISHYVIVQSRQNCTQYFIWEKHCLFNTYHFSLYTIKHH